MELRRRAAAARKAVTQFGVKHWLPLCFLVATVIALTAPAPGRAVVSVTVLGNIHLVQTINIIIVFLISGLVLRTEDIKRALSYWPGIVYGFVGILALTPFLGFALRELPLTPPEFASGLTIFAAVPTTLGVGEALVRASGGNAALALLLLVGTNALGIATMPPWLKVLLSSVDGYHVAVDALSLFTKLLATVLAPAVVGKAARELIRPVGRWATRYKQPLGMLSTVQLALIIWQTLSGAQDVLVQQSFLDIFIVIVAAVLMHGFYLAFNAAATVWVLRMPLKEAIAATIMSSQKSAPVAVTVISYLTSDVTQQGLLAVPCIVGQLAQIFMGSFFAPFLKRRVQRQEALAEPAPPAAPTDAATTEAGDDADLEGGSSDKLEAASSSIEAGAKDSPTDAAGPSGASKPSDSGEVELPTAGAEAVGTATAEAAANTEAAADAAAVEAAAAAEEGKSAAATPAAQTPS